MLPPASEHQSHVDVAHNASPQSRYPGQQGDRWGDTLTSVTRKTRQDSTEKKEPVRRDPGGREARGTLWPSLSLLPAHRPGAPALSRATAGQHQPQAQRAGSSQRTVSSLLPGKHSSNRSTPFRCAHRMTSSWHISLRPLKLGSTQPHGPTASGAESPERCLSVALRCGAHLRTRAAHRQRSAWALPQVRLLHLHSTRFLESTAGWAPWASERC